MTLQELLWRVGEVERRVGQIEKADRGTVTGNFREDLADLKTDIKAMRKEVVETMNSVEQNLGGTLSTLNTRIASIEATEQKRAGVRLTIGSIPIILMALAALGSTLTVIIALAGGFG